MALLVHVTAEKNVARIRRAGIAARSLSRSGDEPGVFCTPLTSSYTVTYQWSRELLRRGDRTIAAVHFQAPDDVLVSVGRYGTDRARVPLDPPPQPRNLVLAELAEPQTPARTIELLEELAARGRGDAHRLAHLVGHPDAGVRESLAWLLSGGFRGRVAAELLRRLGADPVEAVREAAAA